MQTLGLYTVAKYKHSVKVLNNILSHYFGNHQTFIIYFIRKYLFYTEIVYCNEIRSVKLSLGNTSKYYTANHQYINMPKPASSNGLVINFDMFSIDRHRDGINVYVKY